MTDKELYKKIRGCIFGAVIGDAIGENFGARDKDYIETELQKSAVIRYTDDSLMSFGICQQLIVHGEIRVEQLSDIFMYDHLANLDRAYGTGAYFLFNIRKDTAGVSSKRLNRFVSELLYKNSRGSMGNGACMRTSPIGLWFCDRPRLIKKNAVKSARTTHIHPLGVDSAVIMAKAAALALDADKISNDDFIAELLKVSSTGAFRGALKKIRTLLNIGADSDECMNSFLRNETAVESLPFSILTFLRNKDSFEDCLYEAVGAGGDTDTISSMACALSGASLGIEGIPERLLSVIENYDYIEKLIDYFIRARSEEDVKQDFLDMKDETFPGALLEENDKVSFKNIDKLPIVRAMKEL